MFRLIKRVGDRLLWEYNTKLKKDPFFVAVKKWFNDNGDETLRLDYPLSSNAIVLDVGGYKGEWAQDIFDKYDASVYVFEPSKQFANELQDRFKNNPKIQVLPFGLSGEDKVVEMSLQENGTSAHRHDFGDKEQVQLKDISKFCEEHDIDRIDLIKINIEGGEYELLRRMNEVGLIEKCQNLQIQFHDFFDTAKIERDELRAILKQTHQETYNYYFVWENWERRDAE